MNNKSLSKLLIQTYDRYRSEQQRIVENYNKNTKITKIIYKIITMNK